MPELPEVETIRRSLQKAIVGKTIRDVDVRKAKIFQGKTSDVIGERIEAVMRRGKVLIIKLSHAKNLLIHFKLTGQMVWVPEAGKRVTVGHPIPFAGTELPAKTTHVVFAIDGGRLFYNDLRQFGWIKVVDDSELKVDGLLAKLGPEPLDFSRGEPSADKEFTVDYLKAVFSKSSKPIKILIMDQEKIAGVGNIYANDALFEAGILPTREAKSLGDEEIKKLREAITLVLNEGFKYGGSSAADEAYIRPDATPGSYQEHFRVYQRDKEKCRKCGTIIKRINLGGRGTFFCQECQR